MNNLINPIIVQVDFVSVSRLGKDKDNRSVWDQTKSYVEEVGRPPWTATRRSWGARSHGTEETLDRHLLGPWFRPTDYRVLREVRLEVVLESSRIWNEDDVK